MSARPRRLRPMRLLIADLPTASVGPAGTFDGEPIGSPPSADSGRSRSPSPELARVFRPLEALGVELVVTETAQATEDALQSKPFDILVIDARAFGKGAARPWDRRARSGARKNGAIPILLVADPDDPIPAVVAGRALRGSQWDLVHRDAPPEELLLRTERIMDQVQLLDDLERARYHASHDDRTGLLRPLRFDARLREHFSAAQRHRLELALVLVDLDRFGEVNKAYDHTVGDELIARAGSVIRMSLRTEDVGARIGGDEFALILPYTQRVDAARVVTRLAGRFRALSGPPPQRYHGRSDEGQEDLLARSSGGSIAVSASIGFETFDGTDLRSPEELRQRAERALRSAKERGGNQGIYYRSLEEEEEWAPKILHPQPPPAPLTYTASLGNFPVSGDARLFRSEDLKGGEPKRSDHEDERLDAFDD
ncbi:GGDEF domain-containing protein [Saltatorellus ferox]